MIVWVVGLAITMPAIHAYSLLDEFYAMGALLLIYTFAGLAMTLSFAPNVGARGSKWLRRIRFIFFISDAWDSTSHEWRAGSFPYK